MNMIKRILKKIIRRQIKIKKDIEMPVCEIAEGEMDNGCVSLEMLKKKDSDKKIIIYSAGIGDQINFELHILNLLQDKNVELHAFDPTPKSLSFLASQELPENFFVYPYAISADDRELEFALPKAEGWVSGTMEDVKQDARELDFDNKIKVQGRSIKSIMKELGHTQIDLLKMDIEGSEFSVLEAVLDSKLDVVQMLVDHHEYMFKKGNLKLRHLLKKLKLSDYVIYYAETDPNKNRSFSCMKKQYIEYID